MAGPAAIEATRNHSTRQSAIAIARTDASAWSRLASLSRAAEVGPGLWPEESIFLAVTCGDVVIVQESEGPAADNWWMGEIIHIVSGARSLEPSLFQVACIDTGVIKTINADQVTKVVRSVSSSDKARMRYV